MYKTLLKLNTFHLILVKIKPLISLISSFQYNVSCVIFLHLLTNFVWPFLKVSWLRHKDTHLLTIGRLTYTSDLRFRAIHKMYSEDWMLEIKPTSHRDSGRYECQISTTPPTSHVVYLKIAGSKILPSVRHLIKYLSKSFRQLIPIHFSYRTKNSNFRWSRYPP